MSDVDNIIFLSQYYNSNSGPTRERDCTCEFINGNGTIIPYLTYWTYSRMDVAFANPMQYLS